MKKIPAKGNRRYTQRWHELVPLLQRNINLTLVEAYELKVEWNDVMAQIELAARVDGIM